MAYATRHVLFIEKFETRLCLSGVSFASHDIATEFGAHWAYATDIDGDGDNDVIFSIRGGQRIAWYENVDGKGSFRERQVILNRDGPGRREGIDVADLDGDGDVDLLSTLTSEHMADDKIVWYGNTDGNGKFGEQKLIAETPAGYGAAYVADVDGDGDNDVISSSHRRETIVWFENTDGKAAFGPVQLIAEISGDIYPADLDGDDDVDLLSQSFFDDTFSWHENTDGNGSFSERSVSRDDPEFVVEFYAADIDGDGDNDVVLGSIARDSDGKIVDNRIAWYENTDGAGNFAEKKVISTKGEFVDSIYSADIDGDGDLDLVSASYHDSVIAWHENMDGQGSFRERQIISMEADWAHAVHAADLNGDGNLDVLSAAFLRGDITWYENRPLQAGDANGDWQFDQQDVVQVSQAAKYLTGQAATFGQGDWNSDGVFDQKDIITALQTGNYLQGPYAD